LQCAQGDYLAVGWFGPVSDKVAIIGESYFAAVVGQAGPVYAWERAWCGYGETASSPARE
jgi:hypothetical protein